jgi:hypothetical protein
MVEEVIKGKENETLQDKILKIQAEFDEPVIITLSVNEHREIRLEMCLPTRRWNSEDADDGVDSDGPSEISKPDFDMLKNEINYFG